MRFRWMFPAWKIDGNLESGWNVTMGCSADEIRTNVRLSRLAFWRETNLNPSAFNGPQIGINRNPKPRPLARGRRRWKFQSLWEATLPGKDRARSLRREFGKRAGCGHASVLARWTRALHPMNRRLCVLCHPPHQHKLAFSKRNNYLPSLK